VGHEVCPRPAQAAQVRREGLIGERVPQLDRITGLHKAGELSHLLVRMQGGKLGLARPAINTMREERCQPGRPSLARGATGERGACLGMFGRA
jgi:hypothetical protein